MSKFWPFGKTKKTRPEEIADQDLADIAGGTGSTTDHHDDAVEAAEDETTQQTYTESTTAHAASISVSQPTQTNATEAQQVETHTATTTAHAASIAIPQTAQTSATEAQQVETHTATTTAHAASIAVPQTQQFEAQTATTTAYAASIAVPQTQQVETHTATTTAHAAPIEMPPSAQPSNTDSSTPQGETFVMPAAKESAEAKVEYELNEKQDEATKTEQQAQSQLSSGDEQVAQAVGSDDESNYNTATDSLNQAHESFTKAAAMHGQLADLNEQLAKSAIPEMRDQYQKAAEHQRTLQKQFSDQADDVTKQLQTIGKMEQEVGVINSDNVQTDSSATDEMPESGQDLSHMDADDLTAMQKNLSGQVESLSNTHGELQSAADAQSKLVELNQQLAQTVPNELRGQFDDAVNAHRAVQQELSKQADDINAHIESLKQQNEQVSSALAEKTNSTESGEEQHDNTSEDSQSNTNEEAQNNGSEEETHGSNSNEEETGSSNGGVMAGTIVNGSEVGHANTNTNYGSSQRGQVDQVDAGVSTSQTETAGPVTVEQSASAGAGAGGSISVGPDGVNIEGHAGASATVSEGASVSGSMGNGVSGSVGVQETAQVSAQVSGQVGTSGVSGQAQASSTVTVEAGGSITENVGNGAQVTEEGHVGVTEGASATASAQVGTGGVSGGAGVDEGEYAEAGGSVTAGDGKNSGTAGADIHSPGALGAGVSGGATVSDGKVTVGANVTGDIGIVGADANVSVSIDGKGAVDDGKEAAADAYQWTGDQTKDMQNFLDKSTFGKDPMVAQALHSYLDYAKSGFSDKEIDCDIDSPKKAFQNAVDELDGKELQTLKDITSQFGSHLNLDADKITDVINHAPETIVENGEAVLKQMEAAGHHISADAEQAFRDTVHSFAEGERATIAVKDLIRYHEGGQFCDLLEKMPGDLGKSADGFRKVLSDPDKYLKVDGEIPETLQIGVQAVAQGGEYVANSVHQAAQDAENAVKNGMESAGSAVKHFFSSVF